MNPRWLSLWIMLLLLTNCVIAGTVSKSELLGKYPAVRNLAGLADSTSQPTHERLARAYAEALDAVVAYQPTTVENYGVRQAFLELVRDNARLRQQANIPAGQFEEALPASGEEPSEEQRDAMDRALNVAIPTAPIGNTVPAAGSHPRLLHASEKGGGNSGLLVSLGGGLAAAVFAIFFIGKSRLQGKESTDVLLGKSGVVRRAPPVIQPNLRQASAPARFVSAADESGSDASAAKAPPAKASSFANPPRSPKETASNKAPVVPKDEEPVKVYKAPSEQRSPAPPPESSPVVADISPPYLPRTTAVLCPKMSKPVLVDATTDDGVLPNHYVVLGLLGKGGMGLVYLARDSRNSRDVAIKTLSGEAMRVQTVKERFLREYETLLSLDHPNIVHVYDVGFRQIPYYVMEFVGGRDLAATLLETDLTAEQTLEVGIQLSNALVHAHGLGVLHRDIKPSNLMVAPDGRLKIVDFGLVKDLEAQTLTMAGTVLGSLRFMAPEQLLGEKVDGRADVYGVGSTLFYLYAGKTPFEGRPPALKATQEAPTLLQVMPTANPDLSRIIARCLRMRADDRYPTMRDLEKALRGVFF